MVSTPTGLDEALADYRSRTDPDHFKTSLYSDLLVQAFSSELNILKSGRRVFMRLLDQVSPLKRKFILKGTGLLRLLLSISFGSKESDILVVGNGVVGLSAACTLKMLSFDVAIISPSKMV